MADKIQWRRDTAANFTSANTLLAQGEAGYELDTGRVKIGDGVTPWNSLGYNFESGGGVTDHGALTGLSDDDHPQYHNDARGDARYYQKTELDGGQLDNRYYTVSEIDSQQGVQDSAIALNTSKVSFPEAPLDGQQYARQSGAWSVVTGGGGATNHSQLVLDDGTNPHGTTKSDVGLGNVDNTSDLDKPISTDTQTALDLKYDATNPSGYETPPELDARDTSNRDRSNHTGTQLSSTISDLSTAVDNFETVTSLTVDSTGTVLTFNDEDGTANQIQTNVFGSEYEDFIDTSNTLIITALLFAVRSFTTNVKPAGRYRVGMIVQLEPNSTSTNYLFQLRINGNQIGLEMEEEGKDIGGDNRNLRPLIGYYDHGGGTFDIELWGGAESGTLVLHGVLAEVWRVS